jgi:hypothetical protein
MRDCRRNYVGNKLRNPRTKVKNRGSSRTKQLVVMICCWSSFHIQYLCRHRRPPRETGHEEAASKLCCIDVKSFPLLYITEARSSPLPLSSSEASLCVQGFAVYGLGISDYRLIQQLLSPVLSSSFNASSVVELKP